MDFQKRYLEVARDFAEPYKKDKNVIGIVLGGGISRGTGDIYSEVDIYFFVKDKKKTKNLPQRMAGIGGDINVNGVWFEFKVKEFEEERKRDWGMVDRWEANNWKILLERGGMMKRLIKEKGKWRKGERKQLIDELKFKGNWCLALAEIFVDRGDIKHSHMLVNKAIDSYVDTYFIIQGQFVPFYKWKYYYFNRLKRPTKKVKEGIYEAYKIKSYNKKDLKRRIKLMKKMMGRDLGETFFQYHKQDPAAVKNFGISTGVKYENPFEED